MNLSDLESFPLLKLQQEEEEVIRKRAANSTALAAIGPRKKRKLDEALEGSSTSTVVSIKSTSIKENFADGLYRTLVLNDLVTNNHTGLMYTILFSYSPETPISQPINPNHISVLPSRTYQQIQCNASFTTLLLPRNRSPSVQLFHQRRIRHCLFVDCYI